METFSSLRLAVNTQTPLVRFVEGEPRQTTGGVVRMLVPLLLRWHAGGRVSASRWVAMGSEEGDPERRHDGLDLRFVAVPKEAMQGYGLVKERMWQLLNSNPSTPTPHGEGGIPEDAWASFDGYQRRSAEALEAAAGEMGGVDLLYIHDFQQLAVAKHWEGPRPPAIFHLHTPFPSVLPSGWAEYFVAHLRAYDAVIVSTRRYADNLRAAGLDVPIVVIHPFIDPASYPFASASDAARFRERYEIAHGDRVILNVARMDPMKGQDRLIEAMPAILKVEPRARLVLVGNGSFSNSRRGGLGLTKGKTWRADLEALADKLGVAERVTFTGHVDDDTLPAAYEACEIFALPSTREGFGLAVIEAWRHRKPVVVSDRAGVSELVDNGANGLSVDCTDPGALANALASLLRAPGDAQQMGDAAFETSRLATLDVGSAALERLVAGVLEGPRVVA